MTDRTSKLLTASVVALTTLAMPALARAADKKACVAAYEDAQRLRKESHLIEARERLLVCAQEGCPAVLRRDCTQWVVEVEQGTPTLVLEARDGSGKDLIDVKASVDGTVVAERLDGKGVTVDPGPHTVRFETRSGESVEEAVVAREGEKNRRVLVRIGAVPDGTADARTGTGAEGGVARPRPVPTLVYVAGGAGVLGLGTFAYFAALGLSAKGDLDDRQCKPDCPPTDVERAKRRFIIADVGLGVGVVALGIAATLYFTRGTAAPPSTGLRFDAGPTVGGAAAGVSGSF